MGDRTIQIRGLDETVKALNRLPSILVKGAVKGALFAAAALIREQAKANAPVGKNGVLSGLLKKSMYVYKIRNPPNGTMQYIVAARSNRRRGRGQLFGSFTGGAYYWHFVEFGTVKQRPQAYLTRAFLTQGGPAIALFSRELAKGVDKAVVNARGRSR